MKRISKEQILKQIKIENPWWANPFKVPKPFLRWSSRPYLHLFFPLIQSRTVNRAVVLMGPRRVGKTVMIHHAIQKLLEEGIKPHRICYFSVDHPLYTGLGLEQFLELYQAVTKINYQNQKCFFFFDEIQYLKAWEVHLKVLVDRYPASKFIVSGSAAAALRLKSLESGAGRFTDFLLPPLTFYEYLELLGESGLIEVSENSDRRSFHVVEIKALNKAFLHYVNFGGYPEVIFSEEIQQDPHRFIKSDVIDKVLLRDLPSLYGIDNIQDLNYLFTNLAFNTANEVSLQELSQGSGVAKNTIKRYIEYLEAAFLIRMVHRVDRSAKRFKRANFFKVYLTNPSIRSALFAPVKADDEGMGALVETAIFSQWFHSGLPLYYGRWKEGEVDIVSLNQATGKAQWAVEVKWSDRFYKYPDKLRSLLHFCHSQNLLSTRVTTRTLQGKKTIKNVIFEFEPSSLYCFSLGYNIIHTKMA